MRLWQVLLRDTDPKYENIKAPKGKAFLVKAVSFSTFVFASTPNYFYAQVFDFEVSQSFGSAAPSSIAFYSWYDPATTSLVGDFNYQVNNIDHVSKFLSANLTVDGGTVQALITVYGDIINLTESDAVYEWLTKASK